MMQSAGTDYFAASFHLQISSGMSSHCSIEQVDDQDGTIRVRSESYVGEVD